MTWTLKAGFMRGLQSFDDELRRYFGASMRYRASGSKGNVILILDSDDGLVRLVRFLADKVCMNIRVVCLSNPANVKKLVEEAGKTKVRAIIADVDLLNQTNGSFHAWIKSSGNGDIPIFIKGRRDELKVFTSNGNGNGYRFGMFVKEETTAKDYIAALGFPKKCEGLVAEFQHANIG
jgi:hypothetical protein